MTMLEAGEILKKRYPYRKLVRGAQYENGWIIFTENIINGGTALAGVIDNGYFAVNTSGVKPISLMRLPNNLNFIAF